MLITPADFSPINLTTYRRDARGGAADDLLLLFVRERDLLVTETLDSLADQTALALPAEGLIVGRLRGRLVVAVAVEPDLPAPSGTTWAGLRSLFVAIPETLVALAGRAVQLLEWDRTHKYCGACATPTIRDATERARRCPSCRHAAYPRISPAMMCLVTRGREILLARNVNFPAGRYSALAGFLEAGESIEDAIHREVEEEVGLSVTDLRYFSSQSWPFPHSLMIAFTAEYASGELRPNGHEIAEAGWFRRDNLPQLPPRISIARALIDDTIARMT